MIKKTLFVGGGLVLLLGLFFGRDACSYVSTLAGQAQEVVERQIPLSFQLKRAKNQIAKLGPAIKEATRDVIREQLAVEDLEKSVGESSARLAQQQSTILRLKADLERGDESYEYSEVSYTRGEVSEELSTRFDEFVAMEETLKHQKRSLAMRRQVVNASREKIAALQKARDGLAQKVIALEARMKMIEVAQTRSELKIDDSIFSRTSKMVSELEGKIRMQERMVNADTKLRGRIPLDAAQKEEKKDILERVAERFGDQTKESTLVTK